MGYSPNNPLVPGDPYSYDLKWMVQQIKAWKDPLDSAERAEAAAEQAASDAEAAALSAEAAETAASTFKPAYVTAESLGVIGDGITDDTAAINAALLAADKPIVFNKTYKVVVTSLNGSAIEIPSNCHMVLNGSIIMEGCAFAGYDMIHIANKSNVTIEGSGSIIADRNVHTGGSGEWGHALTISSSSNISISGISILNAWGDGLYITKSSNIIISKVRADNNRRNGCSIISGKNIQAVNCKFINSNGTAPENGIDVEPNIDDTELKDILITGCDCSGNSGVSFGVGNRYIDDASVLFADIVANSVSVRNNAENCNIAISNVVLKANSTYYPVTASNTKESSNVIFSDMLVDLNGNTVSGVIYYPESFVYNITFANCVFKNGNTDRVALWSAGSPRGSNNNRFINSTVDVPALTSSAIVPSSDPDVWYGNSICTGSRLNSEEMILESPNYISGSTSELTITGTSAGYSTTVTVNNRAAMPLWVRNESGVAITLNGNDISGFIGGNVSVPDGSIAYVEPVPILHKAICTIYTP